MDNSLREAALEYHRLPTPGKISIAPTKGLSNQRDLALAYSPGVAAACEAIAANPREADTLTSRSNLVAVVTNGTAVLGLGNIGALAGKPVMEGKACLFKKFSGIDVFDLELNEHDPDKIVDIVAALEPTFGGINLEDIKAPECFYIERKLRERMKIPVFHDDQHGTAIIVAAAFLNGLKVVGKDIEGVKLAASGAGAAALACLDLLVSLGLPIENVTVADIHGVVHEDRTVDMDEHKARYAKNTEARTLGEIVAGADVFLGLSAGGVLKPEMVAKMADKPLILALANPHPEILPEDAKAVRPDCVIATGRSDYPNQVNNVLCFPFIFRGALDAGATTINEEMKRAAVHAIADLAHAEQSDIVTTAYGEKGLSFGPEYLIPKPFDPRLIVRIAPAVARAAMDSGVATRPILDCEAYRESLARFVYTSGAAMKVVFSAARQTPRRVAYAEGESENVLRAVQVAIDEKLARPILIGRPDKMRNRIEKFGLRIHDGVNCEFVNIDSDPRYHDTWTEYYRLTRRRGVSYEDARDEVRRRNTLVAAMLVHSGEADAMLCGTVGRYASHMRHINNVIGLRKGASTFAGMNVLTLPEHTVFICDTLVNPDPTPQQLAEITLLAVEQLRRFGDVPRVALLNHSSFGSSDAPSARKMREVMALLEAGNPDFELEGEMQADAAVSKTVLDKVFPQSRLSAAANLLIMPNLDAANIAYNLLKVIAGGGITVGPILLGAAKPVHILDPGCSVRRIVNMTALAAVDAGIERER